MRRMDSRKFEKGFTLVEVLASILIISIILLGAAQLMMLTNKTATSNNSKLVTTHLAKASIERIKIDPEAYFSFETIEAVEREYTKDNCHPNACADLYEFLVNDEIYDVTLRVSQNLEEKELNLVNIFVKVKQSNKDIQTTVEGYVVHETSNE